MPHLAVNGISFGNVLNCERCGRRPEVATGRNGCGPFVLSCWCDTPAHTRAAYLAYKGPPEGMPAIRWQFYRSNYRTRVVRGWNAQQRDTVVAIRNQKGDKLCRS